MRTVIKKRLDRFLITATVIFTFCFVFAGKTATEKIGKQIFDGEECAEVMLITDENTIGISNGETALSIDRSVLKSFSQIKKYVSFSPFGAVVSAYNNAKKTVRFINESKNS